MRNARVALLVALSVLLTACGGDRTVTGLRVMVPNNPGSGYDVTARSDGRGDGGRRAGPQRRGVQPAGRQRGGRACSGW